ncbi:MAG: GntR family transcriptional regulator [Hyphomicrobiaceae bacterium]
MTTAHLRREYDDKTESTPTGRSKPVLRDVAYGRIMELLLNGQLKPGLLVSQRELCERTDTSIGAMREALKRLEAEAVVSLIPQRGVMVRELNHKEINDAYQLRELIEIPAIRHYCEQVDQKLIAEIKAQTEEIIERRPATSEENQKNVRDRMGIDERLHFVIIRSLGNRVIEAVYEKLSNQLRLSRLSVQPRFSDTLPAMTEHLRIIAALEACDADKATEAMKDHLDASRRRALGLI